VFETASGHIVGGRNSQKDQIDWRLIMGKEEDARGMSGPDWAMDLLWRTRQIDPAGDEGAIRRYAEEIAEAQTVLSELRRDDVTEIPLFSASWPEHSPR